MVDGRRVTRQTGVGKNESVAGALVRMLMPWDAKVIADDVATTSAAAWTVAGRSAPKVEGRSFVTGGHTYASDVRRDGMLHGKVLRPPAYGATLAALDASKAEAMPGVVVMATGAWFDPADAAGEPERHGNPNVLTLDIGTSPLAQGTSALTAQVEIERWDQPVPAVRVFTPPIVTAAG